MPNMQNEDPPKNHNNSFESTFYRICNDLDEKNFIYPFVT